MSQTIELTEEEVNAFRAMIACRSACEEVIFHVIREWETVHLSEAELWRRLNEKYRLDIRTRSYVYEPTTGTIKQKSKEEELLTRYDRALKFVDSLLKRTLTKAKKIGS